LPRGSIAAAIPHVPVLVAQFQQQNIHPLSDLYCEQFHRHAPMSVESLHDRQQLRLPVMRRLSMTDPSRRAGRVSLEQLHEAVARAVETVTAQRRPDGPPPAAAELAALSEEELDQIAAGIAADPGLRVRCPPEPCPPPLPIPKCPPVIAGIIALPNTTK
jgi:hypothetical protein